MKNIIETYNNIIEELKSYQYGSIWDNGVKAYAIDILQNVRDAIKYHGEEPESIEELEEVMLDGASSWREYSYAGNALVYNGEIKSRLFNGHDELNPYPDDSLLDVQTYALEEASNMVKDICQEALNLSDY